MKKIVVCFLALMVIGMFVQSHGMAYEWKTDADHSGIMFEVRHIFSSIRGHFSDFSADVFFNPDEPEKSRFDFTVKTDSINTYIGKRDTHLRSDDFFATEKYPEMIFRSSKISLTEGNRYMLEGKMTIKDVSRDMKLEFVCLGQKEHPMKKGAMVIGLETRFTIDRLGFNVGNGKFYKLGVVGKDVDVLISLEMTRNN